MATGSLFSFNAETETPADAARRRAIAEAIMGRSLSPSNVGEGFGAIASGIVANVQNSRASEAEQTGREGANDVFSRIVSGITGGAQGFTQSGGASPALGAANDMAGGGMEAYRNAIASIESAGSGDYSAVGPTHPELGRALGKYQVMEANIGPWSRQVLGREVTPEEFMANPEIQDAIFDGIFGGYVEQFGPEGAAQAWFAGPGGVGKMDRQDSLGTTVSAYTDKFNSALGGAGGAPAMEAVPPGALPPSGAPGTMATGPDGNLYQYDSAGNPSLVEVNGAPTQAMQRVAQGPSIEELLMASQNPWLNDQQRSILNTMIETELARQTPAAPDWQTQEIGGDLYRWNAADPGSQPQLFIDGGTEEAPEIQTFYDDEGREYKAQWNAETQEWEPVGGSKLPSGMSLRVGPDGTVEMVQGAGAKLTEVQSKDINYYTRGLEANDQLALVEDNLTNWVEQNTGLLPLGLGNYMRSPEFRQARVAADNFLAAVLRKDTGAAITPAEFDLYGPMFLPIPGDDPATMQQKRRMRDVALLAIESGLGTAETMAQVNRVALGLEPTITPRPESLQDEEAEPSQSQGGAIDYNAPTAPEGWGGDPALWPYMSPEDRALW